MPEFDFFDGPPFVSSKCPHWGTFSVWTFKDSIIRYMLSKGFSVPLQHGYDCHGFPLEEAVNKILSIKTREDEDKYTLEEYIEHCINFVKECSESWIPRYKSISRLVDPNNKYFTTDSSYMESVWWIFSEIARQGHVYQGARISAYSLGLRCGLSNFESKQEYRETTCNSLYFSLKCVEEDFYFVAWTTTPWTVPSNVALCVNPDLEYVCCDTGEEKYIVASGTEQRLQKDFKSVCFFSFGRNLISYSYYYPFDTFGKIGKVVCDSFVSSTTGTGIVHIAPGFGEDDYRVCLEKGILQQDDAMKWCPLNSFGEYTCGYFEGRKCTTIEKDVAKYLKNRGLFVASEVVKHDIPYCYRTHEPLIYRLIEGWYIRVTNIKDQLISFNEEIQWYPLFSKVSMRNWLSEIRDWNVSRKRKFGTPLPIWKSEDGEIRFISSRKELEDLSGVSPITDMHPHFIDKITFELNGKVYRRVPEVFDCWFESGCGPYASKHYPFENKKEVDEKKYSIEWVAEGKDQVRGWFYTLAVISAFISQRPSCKYINATGIVVDDKGKKFSKSSGNFVDPQEILSKYGVDTVRLYILSSPFCDCETFSFNELDLKTIYSKLTPYSSAVSFFIEHFHYFSDNGHVLETPETFHCFDQIILGQLNDLIQKVEKDISQFIVSSAVREIISFIDILSNWYIRFNRDRLKGYCGKGEWNDSLYVLRTVLSVFSRLLSPFAPDVVELQKSRLEVLDFPETSIETFKIVSSFLIFKKIVENIRAERSRRKVNNKTPIAKILFDGSDEIYELLKLSVEEINFLQLEKREICNKKLYVPILSNIGKQFRAERTRITSMIELQDTESISKENLREGVHYFLKNSFESQAHEFFTEVEGNMVVVNFEVTQEVIKMKQARDIVHHIQNLRSEQGLHPWDKIRVQIFSKNECECKDYIRGRLRSEVLFELADEDNVSLERI